MSEEEILVKRAQEMVGALIWLGKTRLYAIYSINRCAAYTVNNPRRAIRMAKRVLGYLNGTTDMGLVYRTKETMFEGLPPDLARIVETPTVGCTDISCAPRGETKSIQCLIGLVLGAPFFWKSSKQTVSALSTTEAELGGGADGLVMLKGLEALVEELCIGGDYVLQLVFYTKACAR